MGEFFDGAFEEENEELSNNESNESVGNESYVDGGVSGELYEDREGREA